MTPVLPSTQFPYREHASESIRLLACSYSICTAKYHLQDVYDDVSRIKSRIENSQTQIATGYMRIEETKSILSGLDIFR